MKMLKYILVIPIYALLIVGVIGWIPDAKDRWDALIKWAKK